MQPTFDRGRATWHDAQMRHTMDPPSKQDGRGALHRHDLDGRDHDRHHHGWRAPCNEWYRTSPEHEKISQQHISIQQPLKQAMQFFAASVCRDEVVLDLRLSTTKRLMNSACLHRGGKARASQRKLGATSTSMAHSFDETEVEQEEPPEEADLILHDDDDDDDDAEDPESTETGKHPPKPVEL